MEHDMIDVSAIAKSANESGPVTYIRERLTSSSRDDRYVEEALRARVQEVAEVDVHASVTRRITDPGVLNDCLELERLVVARIAFDRMIPAFQRVHSKRVRSLKKARRDCIVKIDRLRFSILVKTGTLGTPESPDTWNAVIRLDLECLEAYKRVTEFASAMIGLSPEHLRYLADGTHPVLQDFDKCLGGGINQFLKDLGSLLLQHPEVRTHLEEIWNDSSVAESVAKNGILARELRYFSELRLRYGPAGRFTNPLVDAS